MFFSNQLIWLVISRQLKSIIFGWSTGIAWLSSACSSWCVWNVLLSLSSLCSNTMTPSDLDRWIEIAKECKYLPENELKVSRPCSGQPETCMCVVNRLTNHFVHISLFCFRTIATLWHHLHDFDWGEQHSARLYAGHHLWRHSRSVLWFRRIVSHWRSSAGNQLHLHGQCTFGCNKLLPTIVLSVDECVDLSFFSLYIAGRLCRPRLLQSGNIDPAFDLKG